MVPKHLWYQSFFYFEDDIATWLQVVYLLSLTLLLKPHFDTTVGVHLEYVQCAQSPNPVLRYSYQVIARLFPCVFNCSESYQIWSLSTQLALDLMPCTIGNALPCSVTQSSYSYQVTGRLSLCFFNCSGCYQICFLSICFGPNAVYNLASFYMVPELSGNTRKQINVIIVESKSTAIFYQNVKPFVYFIREKSDDTIFSVPFIIDWP